MFFQKIQGFVIPLAALAALVLSYRHYGWPGVALVGGGLVMWQLLHFTRMLQVLKRAAKRPIGHVDSAVMLHAKLRPGLPLLHVVAMTRALGQLESPKDTQPECFRWTDTSGSSVRCVFMGGKLQSWELFRPEPPAAAAVSPSAAAVVSPPAAAVSPSAVEVAVVSPPALEAAALAPPGTVAATAADAAP